MENQKFGKSKAAMRKESGRIAIHPIAGKLEDLAPPTSMLNEKILSATRQALSPESKSLKDGNSTGQCEETRSGICSLMKPDGATIYPP